MNEKKHMVCIDVLRSIAIICVVLCHATESVYQLNPNYMADINVSSKLFAFITFIIGRLGVPFFLFITGYLLLDKCYDYARCLNFWKTKWFSLLVTVEIWIIIYHVFLTFYHQQTFYFTSLIKEMLFLKQVNMSHMWYMPMLLGMYLFIPIAANALQTIHKKMLIFPLSIISIYVFLIPIINIVLLSINKNGVSSLLSSGFSGGVYGIYLILGYFLKHECLQKIKSTYLIICTLVSFALTLYLQLFAYSHSYPYNIWYNCGFLMVCALCIFELFKRIRNFHFKKLFYTISKYSFGIYLIHNIIQLLMISYIRTINYLPLQVIILWILSLAVSYFLSLCIRKIPRLGKWLLYK